MLEALFPIDYQARLEASSSASNSECHQDVRKSVWQYVRMWLSSIVIKIKVVQNVIRMSESRYDSMSESQDRRAGKEPALVTVYEWIVSSDGAAFNKFVAGLECISVNVAVQYCDRSVIHNWLAHCHWSHPACRVSLLLDNSFPLVLYSYIVYTRVDTRQLQGLQ